MHQRGSLFKSHYILLFMSGFSEAKIHRMNEYTHGDKDSVVSAKAAYFTNVPVTNIHYHLPLIFWRH